MNHIKNIKLYLEYLISDIKLQRSHKQYREGKANNDDVAVAQLRYDNAYNARFRNAR